MGLGRRACLSRSGTSRDAFARGPERLPFAVRSKNLTLTVYRPSTSARGTIIIGSGDAGWVGLAVHLSEFLVQQGYVVVGFNVREYLSSFTEGSQHVNIGDARTDYRAMSELLAGQGCSEASGAALGRVGRSGTGGGGSRRSREPTVG